MRRPHSILVVDDDPAVSEVLAECLRVPGFSVYSAPDAFEGARVLGKRAIDILIVDIRIPEMSGYEFARQVKILRPNIHTIYMTGYDVEPPDHGPLLLKPFRADEVMRIIQRELELRSVPRVPERPVP
jgi:CheY-like chemotaxis protein